MHSGSAFDVLDLSSSETSRCPQSDPQPVAASKKRADGQPAWLEGQVERYRTRKVRPEPWMRSSDISALVAEGRIERQLRREWDRKQATDALFGGAGVCQRHRAYLRVPAEAINATPGGN